MTSRCPRKSDARHTTYTDDGTSRTEILETDQGTQRGWYIDPTGTRRTQITYGVVDTTTMLFDDGQGHTSTLTGAAGTVDCTLRYDPWGNPLNPRAADNPCNSGTAPNTILYNNTRRDPTTGTYQLGSRTYDPTKAAFTTPDTYRADNWTKDLSIGTDPLTTNRYTYVNGDPINYIDPSGHFACRGLRQKVWVVNWSDWSSDCDRGRRNVGSRDRDTRGYLRCFKFLDTGNGTCRAEASGKPRPEGTAQGHALRGLSQRKLNLAEKLREEPLSQRVHWELSVKSPLASDSNRRVDIALDDGDRMRIWEVKRFSLANIRDARRQVTSYKNELGSEASLGTDLNDWVQPYKVDGVDYLTFQLEPGVIVFAPKSKLERFRDRNQASADRDRAFVSSRIDSALNLAAFQSLKTGGSDDFFFPPIRLPVPVAVP